MLKFYINQHIYLSIQYTQFKKDLLRYYNNQSIVVITQYHMWLSPHGIVVITTIPYGCHHETMM